MKKRKRYAIAGTGVRGLCFAKSLINDHADISELSALSDKNPLRAEGFNKLIGAEIPLYTDFNRLCGEARPDVLIVCTPDFTHHTLIAKAFKSGLDVICEKPLTIDAKKLNYILKLEKEYGRSVAVAFNYRFNPYVARAKDLVLKGRIGRILSVSFSWKLDHTHGREYFRRWHAYMKNSGGLLVHKATHHFDLVNWLLDDDPIEVGAFGDLLVYGRNGKIRGDRCSTCPHAGGECGYEMKTHKDKGDKSIFDRLYWDAEAGDGYIRDRCLFAEDIDIYDTMSAVVRYAGGAQLSYSLNAYSPDPGYVLILTGTEGRMQLEESFKHGIDMVSEDKGKKISVFTGTNRKNIREKVIDVPADNSAHGGGDVRMFRMLFRGDCKDRLSQLADSWQGAMSCGIGIAANTSIKKKKIISVPGLLKDF